MNYTWAMNFEWDEAKSDACFEARGFDFAQQKPSAIQPELSKPMCGTITAKNAIG